MQSNFWAGSKDLDWYIQNILGPVKGQGIKYLHYVKVRYSKICASLLILIPVNLTSEKLSW